jgi:hypothetical protein
MVHPFILAPNFVSVTSSMDVFFPILRRNEVATLWSSLFLIFLCFANCILGILSFWAKRSTNCNVMNHISYRMTHIFLNTERTQIIHE